MNELYKFEELDKKLTEWGFPPSRGSGFGIDVSPKDFKDGKINFGDGGIYFTDDKGHKWKGYMYMPTYKVSIYKSMPRFHLTNCEKIQELFSEGYRYYYKWSNQELNDITDRNTHEVYKDQKLQLCSHCRNTITGITDTEDFLKTLDTDSEIVDILGYDKDWQKISKIYRKNKDYTCESCGIKPVKDFDKRYWHTHHRNGDKANNKPSNLECLCVLCHSYKDHTHEENFDKKRMKRELDSFVNQYREELNEINNPYLRQYLNS